LSIIVPRKALATAASGGSGLSPQDQTILEHLLKAEDCAESYYREMAAKAKNEGFRNIFLMIAKEEAKHTEWLQALAKDGVLGAAVKLNKSFLGDVKSAVEGMNFSQKHMNEMCADQVELYRAARDIEAASRNFYAARAKYATAPALKKLLEMLAAEEDKHYQLLHGLLQFIAGDGEEEIYDMEITNFWIKMDAPVVDMGKL